MKEYVMKKKTAWSKKVASLSVLMLVVSSIASASVPSRGRVTDDTAIYQNLSEIRVARERELNVDSDIARLSALEGRFKEKLPSLSRPIKRVNQQQYRAGRNGN
jgi:hypothetical protein